MRRNMVIAAGLAALISHTSYAQISPQYQQESTIVARGAEARVSVRISIGSADQVRREARPLQLDLVAGPTMQLADGRPLGRSRAVQSEGLRLSIVPGHSTRFLIAGEPVYARYADERIAAAEEEGARRGGGFNGWWIAGGVLVIGLTASVLAFDDAFDCDDGNGLICPQTRQ
jgi:hypothetical protein